MRSNPVLRFIKESTDGSLNLHTRIHSARGFGNNLVYIKREDELSSGVSGSKLRKYASLVKFLKSQGMSEVGIIGGPNSNNLVGLLQILRENRIEPWVFLRSPSDRTISGNSLMLRMLADSKRLIEIQKSDWAEVETIAHDFLGNLSNQTRPYFVVPEGALCRESLPGALTLASDLLVNERRARKRFDRIFIDSGTGMTAIGLVLGLSLLCEYVSQRTIYVTLIAGTSAVFEENLERFRTYLSEAGFPATSLPNLEYLAPPTGAKFGSVNTTILKACHEIAKKEGILMDPVYSAKHYLAAKKLCEDQPSESCALFIYNGSPLGLMGFQTKLSAHSQ